MEAAAVTGTRADLARRLGVTKPAVTLAIKRGRLPKSVFVSDMLLDLEKAEAAWVGSRERERADQPEMAEPTSSAAPESPGLRAAKERTELLRADKLQLELQQARDELRPRVEVERAMVTAGRELRHVLEATVRGWTDELVTLTGGDRQKIAAFLRRKATDVTAAASDGLARLADAPEPAAEAEPQAA